MKKSVLFALILIFQSTATQAKDLRGFLTHCAWGTLGGAAVGVVSLAFTDKPNESWGNVAKGASLGLYAGIAYGVMELQRGAASAPVSDFAIISRWQEGQISEVQVVGTLLRF